MIQPDPITLADEAEERSAADALRAAKNVHDLGIIWTRDCDHFQGSARRRLMKLFDERFAELAPYTRAG